MTLKVTTDETTSPAPDRGDDFVPTSGVTETTPSPAAESATPPAETPAPPAAESEITKAEPGTEPEETSERDEKGRFIPKHRFDLRTRQLRQAEDELKQLRAENATLKIVPTQAPVAVDLSAQLSELDEKIFTARKDGDLDAERRLVAESRKVQQAHFDAQLSEARSQSSSEAVERVSIDGLINELEAAHPALDPGSESFSKEVTDELVELWEAYEARGYSKENALLKAATVLLREVAPAEKAEAAKPAGEAEEAELADPRRAADVRRNVKTVQKSPPDLDAAGGLDSDKAGLRNDVDPLKLSEADLAALPLSVKQRLRGDFF